MTTRMLIDARHPEETRVAVVTGNRIEEFDFESEEHKQLKGNIYLAKVTRVEPSLQAAFIDYGGNRHGFLAFSEIHPDYYQIPKEDREALLREEAEHAAEEERLRGHADDEDDEDGGHAAADDRDDAETVGDDASEDEHGQEEGDAPPPRKPSSTGGDDHNAVEALRQKRMNLRHRYKIQDVIRRRQVLLVQVVKEERGNKGAALTTYLSLAGRYCVLMPNTSHGGGISRKISNGADRKRLKAIMADLSLPRTMGCIVRTAGLQRTKTEIKRDFDYLARLWDEIRERTLHSAAPALIHEDSGLIKRAIRDIYNREIDDVIVEGEDGWRSARSFMKLLMPSHAKKVQHYADAVPLFQRFGVEDQLAAMYQPLVQLKSGGYLVINPTEALVSIDINSGRSTREHNIEQTAFATNIEAAREIARQLRLRDMAGLVVIDFIDMEVNSNVRKVEKAMKDALKDDRARIQVGRISSFGLMEMSRQRLRTGVLEASTRTCPHCEGTGLVRTASSAGLSALRMLEEEAARGRGSRLLLRSSQEAAFYVLNRKRGELAEIEDRYGVGIEVMSDGTLEGARMTVEAGGPPPARPPKLPEMKAPIEDEEDDFVEDVEEDEIEEEETVERDRASRGRGDRQEREERPARADGEGDEGDARRRRRRRRRRGGRPDEGAETPTGEVADQGEAEPAGGEPEEQPAREEEAAGDGASRRRGRRGRRGGRRREGSAPIENASSDVASESGDAAVAAVAADEAPAIVETADAGNVEAVPRPRRRPRARKVAEAEPASGETIADAAGSVAVEAVAEDAGEAVPARPRRGRRKAASEPEAQPAEVEVSAPEPVADAKPARRARSRKAEPAAVAEAIQPEVASEAEAIDAAAPREQEPTGGDSPARRGWWQRTFGN